MVQDYCLFIKLMLGLAACTIEQLGYDSSMKIIAPPPDTAEAVYEIDVHSDSADAGQRTFITRRIIADFGANSMCGRGTRVWAVVDREDRNTEYVLKDYWVDFDRNREGNILKEIRAKELDMPESEAIAGKHLLKVETHGDVLTSYRVRDSTLSIHRGSKLLSYGRRIDLTKSLPSRTATLNSQGQLLSPTRSSGLGNVPVAPRPRPMDILQDGKLTRNMEHYRIVFKGVGKSVYELESFREVFTAILGAIYGMLDSLDEG
jgi:hypothetical protein